MTTNYQEGMAVSREMQPVILKLNLLIKQAYAKGVEVEFSIRKNDPLTGDAPMICVDIFGEENI